MNIISLFFSSMRIASKIDHASHNADAGDSEDLINELCPAGPRDRVEKRSPARDVEIDDTLPHPV